MKCYLLQEFYLDKREIDGYWKTVKVALSEDTAEKWILGEDGKPDSNKSYEESEIDDSSCAKDSEYLKKCGSNKMSEMDKTPISDDYKRTLLKFGASPKQTEELFAIIEKLSEGYVWHDYDAGEDTYEDNHEGNWVLRDEISDLYVSKNLLEEFIDDFYSPKSENTRRSNLIQYAEGFIDYKARKETKADYQKRLCEMSYKIASAKLDVEDKNSCK